MGCALKGAQPQELTGRGGEGDPPKSTEPVAKGLASRWGLQVRRTWAGTMASCLFPLNLCCLFSAEKKKWGDNKMHM